MTYGPPVSWYTLLAELCNFVIINGFFFLLCTGDTNFVIFYIQIMYTCVKFCRHFFFLKNYTNFIYVRDRNHNFNNNNYFSIDLFRESD